MQNSIAAPIFATTMLQSYNPVLLYIIQYFLYYSNLLILFAIAATTTTFTTVLEIYNILMNLIGRHLQAKYHLTPLL